MRTDPDRLAALRELLILDSGPESAFDDITRLLSKSLAVPVTMVNLLDAERDWFKSCFGVQQTQSPAVSSFCEAFFDEDVDVVVVEDTLHDARFSANPKVVGRPYIRFYAAARLVVRGQTAGTLCAYDMAPRKLTQAQFDDLRALAGAVTELLDRRLPDGAGPPRA